MTSDGISTEEWEVVQAFAERIANACDDTASEDTTRKLLRYLETLEAKYGKLPSILATKADYILDVKERVRLLEEAFELATHLHDKKNLMLVASSLSELFIKELQDVVLAEKWLGLFASALGDQWDDFEYQELQAFTEELQNLKLRKE